MAPQVPDLKKLSAELLVLAAVEDQPRHGYDIARHIDRESEGRLRFHVASFYPMLYRLEQRGWIKGRWVEKTGQRRRRYYRLTPPAKRCWRRSGSNGRNCLPRSIASPAFRSPDVDWAAFVRAHLPLGRSPAAVESNTSLPSTSRISTTKRAATAAHDEALRPRPRLSTARRIASNGS